MQGSYGSLTKPQKFAICTLGLVAFFCILISIILFFFKMTMITFILMGIGALLFVSMSIIWICFEKINKRGR